MECLFVPAMHAGDRTIELPESETRHARSLRLAPGDAVLLSNGLGVLAEATFVSSDRVTAQCEIQATTSFDQPQNERLWIAMGILDNRDRMEWAIEKLTEMGVTDFIPLKAHRSQRTSVNIKRLAAKSVAALKQARRSFLPRIHPVATLDSALQMPGQDTLFILGDSRGAQPQPFERSELCILIGPEGGFTDEERHHIGSVRHRVVWNLGDNRLRAETAALAATTCVHVFGTFEMQSG